MTFDPILKWDVMRNNILPQREPTIQLVARHCKYFKLFSYSVNYQVRGELVLEEGAEAVEASGDRGAIVNHRRHERAEPGSGGQPQGD